MKNDAYYATHISFPLDVKIFFKTIACVLSHENVYRDTSGDEKAREEADKLRAKENAKTIMILGASILQLPAIKKALEDGLTVVAVDMNPDAIGFKEDGVIKEVVSTIDIPKVIEVAKKHKIDGVMTLASDMPMRTVAAVSKELGLVGIDEDTAVKATDKACMRDALKAAGVPIPLYYRVKNKDEFADAVDKIKSAGYKVIVQPADNSGSRGVNLLSDDSDPSVAYDYAAEYSRDGEILVEEFMEGAEVSVETIAVNGEVNV